jgi:hypothetical protein
LPQQRVTILFFTCVAFASLLTLSHHSAQADIRVVTAVGEHRLSDRETKEQGIRLATEQAKKHALEEVATYLESITVVRDLDVTQDDIRSYTAGVVIVQDQQVNIRLDGEEIIVRVSLSAQLDTEEIARAITLLKHNEDARAELVALKQEVDELQAQLEQANQAVRNATSSEQARQLNQQRQELLNRAQSDGMVAQAWTEWVLAASLRARPGISPEFPQVQALLGVAGQLNPSNPRVAIAQTIMTTKAPPIPPEPPHPPMPGSRTPTSPGIVSDNGAPLRPNPQGSVPVNPRQLSSVHQLNPFLPDPMEQSPAGGTSVTIIQVPVQGGAPGGRPSDALRKMYQQVPARKTDEQPRTTAPTLHTFQLGGTSALPPKATQPSESVK